MAYRIEFTERADKAMRKLDKSVASTILDEMEVISALENPRSKGKALSGNLSGFWRYRIGDYRVICDIEDEILVVLVVDVDHRSRVYKHKS